VPRLALPILPELFRLTKGDLSRLAITGFELGFFSTNPKMKNSRPAIRFVDCPFEALEVVGVLEDLEKA
jgi:hypothetical protein